MFEIWYYENENPRIAKQFYKTPFHNFESAKQRINEIKNHPSTRNITLIILDKNTDRFINVR